MIFLISLGVVLVIALIATLALSYKLASKVVLPGRKKFIHVRDYDASTVTLSKTPETIAEGTYGLWLDAAGEHLEIGEVVTAPQTSSELVTRTVRKVRSIPRDSSAPQMQGRWTGHVSPTPIERYRELILEIEDGVAPAWLIEPSGEAHSSIWAIHIHGIRTTRVTALRTVYATQKLGYISLVPSFRGDGEASDTERNASSLGQTEWHDVEAAISYAVAQGAEKIVLFAWSMGAQIALRLATESLYKDFIYGLVMIGPALDWSAAIRAGAVKAKLPAASGRLAELILESKWGSGRLGLREALDFVGLDWTNRDAPLKCLIIHATGDDVVPFSSSKLFADRNPDSVELIPFSGNFHSWEWNQHPDVFTETIREWCERSV